MSLTSKGIFKILTDNLSKVEHFYPKENIFGIFVYGKANDDDVEEVECEDIFTEAIVLPSFSDVCLSLAPRVIEITTDYVNNCKIVDIRKLYNATKNGHDECIEGLKTGFYIINPRYKYLFETLLLKNADLIQASITKNEDSEELRFALVKILRYWFNDNSNTVKFIKQLTDAEKVALEGIVQKYGCEGIFKQNVLASDLGLSRLTLTKLIGKMKEFEVADIIHQGPNGTYFKILDETLLNIRGYQI